jgi:small subunit ribosomal protein S18
MRYNNRSEGKEPMEPRRRKVCWFCDNKLELVPYRSERMLRRFVNERGKIISRRVTGCCAGHQRKVTVAVKRARILAILAFESESFR